MINLRNTAIDSFHGHFLYDQVVDREHFFVKLAGAVDWRVFTNKLMKLYKGARNRQRKQDILVFRGKVPKK